MRKSPSKNSFPRSYYVHFPDFFVADFRFLSSPTGGEGEEREGKGFLEKEKRCRIALQGQTEVTFFFCSLDSKFPVCSLSSAILQAYYRAGGEVRWGRKERPPFWYAEK